MDRSLCKKGLRVRLIGPKSLWGRRGAKISARQFDQMNPGDELVLDENGAAISLARRNGDPDRFAVNLEIVEPAPEAPSCFPPLKPGDRVARGPDWHWNDQDGGAGSTGVVLDEPPCSGRFDVHVRWTNGTRASYAYGNGGKHDIALAEVPAVAALKRGEVVNMAAQPESDWPAIDDFWASRPRGTRQQSAFADGGFVPDKNQNDDAPSRFAANKSVWNLKLSDKEPTMPRPKPSFSPGERVWHVNRKDWNTLLEADPGLNAGDRYNALSDDGDRYTAIGELLRRPGEPDVPEDASPKSFAPGQRWRLVATARGTHHSYLKPGDDALVEAVDANGDALLADGKGRFALRRIADGDIVLLTPTETLKNPTKKDTPMTPIQITKPTLVDGNQISSYTARDRSALLSQHENEIKRLEALEFKTQETKDEIAALRAGVVAAIAEFDAEYAARKAAEAEA